MKLRPGLHFKRTAMHQNCNAGATQACCLGKNHLALDAPPPVHLCGAELTTGESQSIMCGRTSEIQCAASQALQPVWANRHHKWRVLLGMFGYTRSLLAKLGCLGHARASPSIRKPRAHCESLSKCRITTDSSRAGAIRAQLQR